MSGLITDTSEQRLIRQSTAAIDVAGMFLELYADCSGISLDAVLADAAAVQDADDPSDYSSVTGEPGCFRLRAARSG